MAHPSALAMLILVLCLAAAGEARRKKSIRPTKHTRTLHFYMHDMVNLSDSKQATTVLVAGPRNNIASMSTFGSVMVIDDPLTAGPSMSSKLIGRARGTYLTDASSTSSPGLFITFTAVLEDGCVCLHGQDDITKPVRELAIIGGTGAYRFVTGYAQLRTQKIIPPFSVILSVKVFMRDG